MIQGRIPDKEGICVPEDEQLSLEILERRPPEIHDLLQVLARHDPADRVRADELAGFVEIDHVAAGLVELLARCREHWLE